MKKILLLFMMCGLLPLTAGAQGTPTDDTFTMSDLTWDDGQNAYRFTVSLLGSRIYTAYNMDITFPAGINVKYAGGRYYVRLYTSGGGGMYTYDDWEETYSHSLNCSMPQEQVLRVACASNNNINFKANSGILFTVYVTINESAFTSTFSPKPIIKLSGLNLTTSAAVKYVPADFACRPFTTGIPTSRTLPINVSAANKVGTLILPFDVDLPSGLKAYTCNGSEGDLLTLTPAESLAACTPYIVYAESGYTGNLSGTVDMSEDYGTTDVFADGYLTGVLTGTTVSTGYILQNQGEGPMFYDAEGVTFSLPAGRCYLTPPSGGEVKVFSFDLEGTTSIEEMFNIQCSMFNTYDLQGRKVSSPSRGIYIQGTRKAVFTK